MSANYDWSHLNDTINPQTNVLKFSDVKDHFKKVAFDVYKQEGSSKLWELRSEEGGEYLVALYDDGDTDMVVESQDEVWTATADNDGENVTLSYKKTPIARFAGDKYQYSPEKAEKFAKFIEKKASNSKFIEELLSTMPEQKKLAVLTMLKEGDK